jgi:uncharacterized protein
MKASICTFSGIEFDLLNPKSTMIKVVDIVHSLSNMTRFTGHTLWPYFISQHSVLVHEIFPHLLSLCHDFPESYIGDVSSPLKSILPDYRLIEYRITETISEALQIDLINLPKGVKDADYFALKIEQCNLMPVTDWWDIDKQAAKLKIYPWSSKYGKYIFEQQLKQYKSEWF